jgi:hypothetical protein
VGLAEQVSAPLVTCEAVLTEAAYLLDSAALVLEVLAAGLVRVEFNLPPTAPILVELAHRYGDQYPDLCDLCVVRLSELFPDRHGADHRAGNGFRRVPPQ